MRQPDFELTSPERELLATIKLNPLSLCGYEDDIRNGNAVYQLMNLLLARRSIPLPRVKFFADPNYNVGGRGKSREAYFERNGCKGKEIFRHPHFLEYLKYFLYGPDLPLPVIQEFRDIARFMREITPRSISLLSKPARNMALAYSLDPDEAGDEFYKLALDCGLTPAYANDVRQAVRKSGKAQATGARR